MQSAHQSQMDQSWPSTGVLTFTSAFCARWRSRWSIKRDGHHRFGDRCGADANTGVMTALGIHVDRVALHIDGTARRGDAGGRFQRQVRNDRLARNPRMPPALLLRNPSGVSSSRCSVPRWATLASSRLSTPLTALMLISAWASSASRRSRNRLAQAPGITPSATTVIFAPTRILVAAQLVHVGLELRHLVRVEAEEGVVLDRFPGLERNLDRAQLAHVATHGDALGGQVLLGDGTCRNTHGRFTGRAAAAAA